MPEVFRVIGLVTTVSNPELIKEVVDDTITSTNRRDPYVAEDYAKYLIAVSERLGLPIDPIRINSLMYMSQVRHLDVYGVRLFDRDTHAMYIGPWIELNYYELGMFHADIPIGEQNEIIRHNYLKGKGL